MAIKKLKNIDHEKQNLLDKIFKIENDINRINKAPTKSRKDFDNDMRKKKNETV